MSGFRIPIHSAGWPFVGIAAAVTAGLALIDPLLGLVGAVATVAVALFFRDPDRTPPADGKVLLSPADGVVQAIASAAPPPELNAGDHERTRISVFMSVLDVHVNRIPVDGTVRRLAYRPGQFINASLDKASEANERQSVLIEGLDGTRTVMVQIAGLIARRIRCDLTEGLTVSAGSRFGIIRFGSRVDVYLPDGAEPRVAVGERTIAGETVLAAFVNAPTSDEPGD